MGLDSPSPPPPSAWQGSPYPSPPAGPLAPSFLLLACPDDDGASDLGPILCISMLIHPSVWCIPPYQTYLPSCLSETGVFMHTLYERDAPSFGPLTWTV